MPGSLLGSPLDAAADGRCSSSNSSSLHTDPALPILHASRPRFNPRRPYSSRSATSPLSLGRWADSFRARGATSHTPLTSVTSITPLVDNCKPTTAASSPSIGSIRQKKKGSMGNMTIDGGRIRRRRPSSVSRQPTSRPQLSREEFEALPVAIQRKYFSTLERLRFAQPPNQDECVDQLDTPPQDIPAQNLKRRRGLQEGSPSSSVASLSRRASPRTAHFPSAELADLPEKIKKRQFTREDQVVLARHLRASVIFDAADEAIYKIGRRSSRHLNLDVEAAAPALSSRPSMESRVSNRYNADADTHKPQSPVPNSFYDSFRWLEEEEELDLRLDDYHANLREREDLPTVPKSRPTFRRHMSISKIPFGRASVSSSRPATKDASSPTAVVCPSPPFSHGSPEAPAARRRSRALSLITPRHVAHNDLSVTDSEAAHYQDPEARLKLRVYLASPQKFDEAIEFGFPSQQALSASPVITKENEIPKRRQSRQKATDESDVLQTFLEDDKSSTYSDDVPSVTDPDSPKTPQTIDKPLSRPMRVNSDPIEPSHAPDAYAQAPASSREMTLRMTLTRPDLRAHEEQIYGWQKGTNQPSRRSHSMPGHGSSCSVSYIGGRNVPKESIERVLNEIDPWSPELGDRGVMKRIWNRVRRGPA